MQVIGSLCGALCRRNTGPAVETYQLRLYHAASHRAVQHGKKTKVSGEVVGDFAVVGGVENGQVSVFARLNGALTILQPQGPRSIDGSSRNGLGGSHLHVGASERED